MKTRVLIGLLVVSALCVLQVWGQGGDSTAPACCPAQKVATTGSETGSACCASQTQTACSGTAAPATLTSLTGQSAACCASQGQATACTGTTAAKLAGATAGCPLQAAGIQLTQAQQTKVHAILAQARRDLLAVLNSDQQAKFAQVSLASLVLGKTAGVAVSTAADTQPCCATKTAGQVCSGDCQKPCCAAKANTVAEQTTCPIMGSAINKAVFTVYQGKKVYFCCPGCDKAFTKNPEKYTKNLPQFN